MKRDIRPDMANTKLDKYLLLSTYYKTSIWRDKAKFAAFSDLNFGHIVIHILEDLCCRLSFFKNVMHKCDLIHDSLYYLY